MKSLQRKILEQLIHGLSEPVLVARIDQSDWPIVFCNPAFETIATGDKVIGKSLADVSEALVGRELAQDLSESIRLRQSAALPAELDGRDFLVVLKPLASSGSPEISYYAAYWRSTASFASSAADREAQRALLQAKRRIRDLAREDPVTGLLNEKAFRDVLAHDWAVAAREKRQLALIAFSLQDFDQYVNVFGKHAADSCMRRVSQTIRRCLRRASDVAARVAADDGDRLVVLSHASGAAGVDDFAAQIAGAVRDLGLHHPRSRVDKFVTVNPAVRVRRAGEGDLTAEQFLLGVLSD